VDVSAEGSVSANVGASKTGDQGRGAAIGAHLGVFRVGRIERRVEMRGGKVVVTIRVLSEKGYAAGASGGFGVASMGYTREESEGQSAGATFVFDPDDASQAALYQRVTSITSEADLRALAGHQNIVGQTTEGKTKTTGGTTDATVLGVGISLRETGTL